MVSNYRKGNSRGGFEGNSRFSTRKVNGRNRDSERRRILEMHDVICSKCRKQCKVPFKPTGDKPVYCSDCFGKTGNPISRNRGSRQDSSNIPSEKLDEINSKLDKIIDSLNIE